MNFNNNNNNNNNNKSDQWKDIRAKPTKKKKEVNDTYLLHPNTVKHGMSSSSLTVSPFSSPSASISSNIHPSPLSVVGPPKEISQVPPPQFHVPITKIASNDSSHSSSVTVQMQMNASQLQHQHQYPQQYPSQQYQQQYDNDHEDHIIMSPGSEDVPLPRKDKAKGNNNRSTRKPSAHNEHEHDSDGNSNSTLSNLDQKEDNEPHNTFRPVVSPNDPFQADTRESFDQHTSHLKFNS
ncbi:hypothetical protein RFI_09465 [Reticulomyxa filosa]|uniref:Uncharacterized protein n=1 Tax=Reticulomyxa filosa TaxID=46433 RepID=X6NQM8_RETFI|nr:hypothetical protein RFI_09465 [Reticulomyxa filosa]|eukprot:ETO27667.1 hypothetical protein RFI_09465 [Reticulomyxa filosa]